ncbi:uncharacterized protein [Linepithema humile]|uniref:uncharacterized protein isoform X2 n=1 Tax=Linepithema humile TaxID=83485 RepID=UPI00351EC24C
MKRSAYIEQAKLPANVKQRRSYRTLARWAERDAFSFDDIQLSDISTIAFDELKSNNDHTSSDSKCETHNYSSSTDDARYQTSTDCVEPSIVSTQIVRCESNNEEIMTLFAKRGGRNAYEITTNILSKAFTNKFACEFSYFGKQKKKALSKFKITKCIIVWLAS